MVLSLVQMGVMSLQRSPLREGRRQDLGEEARGRWPRQVRMGKSHVAGWEEFWLFVKGLFITESQAGARREMAVSQRPWQ